MLSRILDVLAARLLALMLFVFSVLVLAPAPLARPQDHVAWGSNAYNLAAVGAAAMFAESIAIRRRGRGSAVRAGTGVMWTRQYAFANRINNSMACFDSPSTTISENHCEFATQRFPIGYAFIFRHCNSQPLERPSHWNQAP